MMFWVTTQIRSLEAAEKGTINFGSWLQLAGWSMSPPQFYFVISAGPLLNWKYIEGPPLAAMKVADMALIVAFM